MSRDIFTVLQGEAGAVGASCGGTQWGVKAEHLWTPPTLPSIWYTPKWSNSGFGVCGGMAQGWGDSYSSGNVQVLPFL